MKKMNYEEIANQIIRMKNTDLEFRKKLILMDELGESYDERMASLHNKNSELLNEIINKIGYPTVEMVGQEASEAAWLVVQHSIERPQFMKKVVELLKLAVKQNKADPKNLAYLTDRIAVFEEKPQRFGTQFDWDKNSKMNPNQFDDLAKVNQRRKALSLPTLEEQTEIMKERVKNENQQPPKNFKERERAYNKWRKSVGWIK